MYPRPSIVYLLNLGGFAATVVHQIDLGVSDAQKSNSVVKGTAITELVIVVARNDIQLCWFSTYLQASRFSKVYCL
jgi:hypothetical protein